MAAVESRCSCVSEGGANRRGTGSHTEDPWLGRVKVNAFDSLFKNTVSMGGVVDLPRTGDWMTYLGASKELALCVESHVSKEFAKR